MEKWPRYDLERGNAKAFTTVVLKNKKSRMIRHQATAAMNRTCECDREIEAMAAEPVYLPDLIVDLGRFLEGTDPISSILTMNLGFHTMAEIGHRDPDRSKAAF